MKLPNLESTFAISEKGDETGHQYIGTFTVKCILSKREEFLADARRRELLGAMADDATVTVRGNAFALSQLFVRIVDAPEWWVESDNGADLYDNNVIAEVFAKALEAADEWRKKISGEADKAEKVVKKTATRKPKSKDGDEDE